MSKSIKKNDAGLVVFWTAFGGAINKVSSDSSARIAGYCSLKIARNKPSRIDLFGLGSGL
ncbi:MAG: hypothetical protein IPI46_13060 [Bacteroidetes bacterium]|nr:hypothetical protein [Bacteroidota bacterium]MBK7764253.1 hypothetical protein [Bacteroidota bacterium]